MIGWIGKRSHHVKQTRQALGKRSFWLHLEHIYGGKINAVATAHTYYTDFWFCGSEKTILCFFHIISLWKIMTPPGRGQFGPQGHDW